MKMTTRGRYAVTAMLDLALRVDSGPVSLAEIAERQGLSLSYLEQLFALLRQHGLVKSTRGPGGGYQLSAEPGDISVSAVVKAVNESGAKDDSGRESCYLSRVWDELSQEIEQFLNSVSLADVLASNEVRSIADRQQRNYMEKSMDMA